MKKIFSSLPILGLLSSISTYLILLLIALCTGSIPIVLSELAAFLTGNFSAVVSPKATFLMMFPVIFAVVILELPCTLLTVVFMKKTDTDQHATSKMMEKMKTGNHFFALFMTVLCEELFARFFFLGMLTQVPFLDDAVGFYALLLIGNGGWSYMHLINYKKEDRHLVNILPQFVGGIFFSYVFVKYGLLATVLTHFVSNSILFALHKCEFVHKAQLPGLIYVTVCGIISYTLMTKPLADLQIWLADTDTFLLKGWKWQDYLLCSIFFYSGTQLMFSLLLYDHVTLDLKKHASSNLITRFFEQAVGLIALIAILYIMYRVLSVFTSKTPERIFFLALTATFLIETKSMSATMRIFWTSIPLMYINVCIWQALTPQQIILLIVAEVAIAMPKKFIDGSGRKPVLVPA